MQIQLRYDMYEDRLVLLLATTDEQTEAWWLTRRATIMLMTALAARLRACTAKEEDPGACSPERLQELAARNVSYDAPPLEADNRILLVSMQGTGLPIIPGNTQQIRSGIGLGHTAPRPGCAARQPTPDTSGGR